MHSATSFCAEGLRDGLVVFGGAWECVYAN
jgi:hypothetical protein